MRQVTHIPVNHINTKEDTRRAGWREFWQFYKHPTIWGSHLFGTLIALWLPDDILTQYPILKGFTSFMNELFPMVGNYARKSQFPQISELYFSAMIALGPLWFWRSWVTKACLGEAAAHQLQNIAGYFNQNAKQLLQQSATALQRAEFSKQMWLQLDGLSNAVFQQLNSVNSSQLETQIITRIEAMKLELGKAESFANAAQQSTHFADNFAALGKKSGSCGCSGGVAQCDSQSQCQRV